MKNITSHKTSRRESKLRKYVKTRGFRNQTEETILATNIIKIDTQ